MSAQQYIPGDVHNAVMALASPTVFAIANTRLRGDIEDATAVLSQYLEDAEKAGASLPISWTLLATAAINEFTTAISQLAALNGVSAEVELGETAMSFALEAGR